MTVRIRNTLIAELNKYKFKIQLLQSRMLSNDLRADKPSFSEPLPFVGMMVKSRQIYGLRQGSAMMTIS